MIPAHNAVIGIVTVLDLVDVLPRVLGKSDVGTRLRGVDPRDAGLNDRRLAILTTDQDATNLCFAAGARVLADLPYDVTINDDRRLRHIGFEFVLRHRPAANPCDPRTSPLSPEIK